MNAQRLRRARAAHDCQDAPMATAHDFAFRRIGGDGDIALKDFAGKAILVVNVASACGFTPQYRELQALWEAKGKAGLIVLGVPCNDFGAQEQGSEDDIRTFCANTYHVTFPMTAKVEITGAGRHPFYQWIAHEAGQEALPRWNFHKYLIGKQGALVESFSSKAAPMGAEMLRAIEKTLAS